MRKLAKPPAVTVALIVRLYLNHAEAENVHSHEARSDRVRTLSAFAKFVGDLRVADAKPFHLLDFIHANQAWKSVSTRRAKANMIRAAFQWAFLQERIQRNPFASVRFPEAERRCDMPDDLLDRLASLSNKPFERVLKFLRYTACRLGELCAATWNDVDLDRGLWIIPRHKSRKRTGKPKIVALVPEAVDLLRSIAAGRSPADRGDSPIFLNTAETPWNRITLGQQLRRMKKRHGITHPASLHGIRHRFGSCAVANGAPLKLVAAQMGHRSVTTTERYYVCLDGEIEAIRQAAARALPRSKNETQFPIG